MAEDLGSAGPVVGAFGEGLVLHESDGRGISLLALFWGVPRCLLRFGKALVSLERSVLNLEGKHGTGRGVKHPKIRGPATTGPCAAAPQSAALRGTMRHRGLIAALSEALPGELEG
jgi:hypothetical protein